MAYWVFQQLGNLPPSDLDRSELYREVQAAEDGGAALAAQMEDAGRQTGHSRWSFARRIGETQLVVIDSRAGRDVTPGRREPVQDEEWGWIAASSVLGRTQRRSRADPRAWIRPRRARLRREPNER